MTESIVYSGDILSTAECLGTRALLAPCRPEAGLPRQPRRSRVLRRGIEPHIRDRTPECLLTADGRTVSVVHLSAELAPFVRAGGLGEAVAGLACAQAAKGLPTVVFVPLYQRVSRSNAELRPVSSAFSVQIGSRRFPARLYELVHKDWTGLGTPRVYFIQNRELFDRDGLYDENGLPYSDNARRFAFFSRAALEALRLVAPGPAVLHAHDWHTALAPVLHRSLLRDRADLREIVTVFTVHNAGYQGLLSASALAELGLPRALFNWSQLEWHGQVNLLKGGVVFADRVTTVSPRHADELRTPLGGFGLDGTFESLGDRLVGITNGIEEGSWDPANDRSIPSRYSADNFAGKRRCRTALQRELGLERRPWSPILAMSARLVEQKGLDLLLNHAGYFALDAQFVFLGSGEGRYVEALRSMAKRAPNRISVTIDFNEEAERRLLAGADMCLMPSLYEPCGLTQMRAQRYGTIPVARRVGGLADTVEDGVTGFLFDEFSASALLRSIERAVTVFRDPGRWREMVIAAMRRDFSWRRSIPGYMEVYRRALDNIGG